jgi:hypothetical protein
MQNSIRLLTYDDLWGIGVNRKKSTNETPQIGDLLTKLMPGLEIRTLENLNTSCRYAFPWLLLPP